MNFARSTGTERQIITRALQSYDHQLKVTQGRTENAAVKNEATWRRHVIERLLADLDAA